MDELKIERDARVLAGERELGRVRHVIVDPQTKEITQVVVAHDGRESTVPIAAVASTGGGVVRLRDGADTALRGDFVRDAFHALDDRTADAENAGVATHGGAPLRDAAADAVVIARPDALTAPVDPIVRATDATEREVRVPIVEERLTVDKREAELGEVAIHKTVTEEERTVPVTLHREEVRVQERDVQDRPLRAGEEAFKEGTIRVALRGEEAVVTKEAVVTGEVVVNKETVTREEQVSGTVRKQHVEVDQAYQQARSGLEQAHTTRTGGKGRTFEQAEPHYRAGFDAAHDERHAGRDFAAVEPDLRAQHAARGTGDDWETLRREVREGWDRARKG